MNILYLDFETSGLPDYPAPSDASHQPHITQIAAYLVDKDRKKLGSLDLLIRPEGWRIPDDLVEKIGISNERAALGGVNEWQAVYLLYELIERSHQWVAHNKAFDYRILRIALKRMKQTEWMDDWEERYESAFCTMQRTRQIIKLPATTLMHITGRHGPKSPKLPEAYKFFTGKELTGHHTAMHDVLAVKAIHEGCLLYQDQNHVSTVAPGAPQEPAEEQTSAPPLPMQPPASAPERSQGPQDDDDLDII